MKNKFTQKIAAMRNSEKKGMEILGWILTIVLGIAVVGIIWFFVQPTIDNTANEAAQGVTDDSSNLIGSANSQVEAGVTNAVNDSVFDPTFTPRN